ncbi:MAG: hypothetical protein AAF420_02735, partial [Pseudomonadota bacterium]
PRCDPDRHDSIPNIDLDGAPANTDYSRWAMLHDGTRYRLYFFIEGSDTQLHQFAFNPTTNIYEYDFDSVNPINLIGAPADANPESIAMLHDGATYRLYMRGISNPTTLYQFAWNGAAYEYGFNSIDMIPITNAPVGTDLDGWAMLHDGAAYRLYAYDTSAPDQLFQFSFNGSSYEFGHNSISVLAITDMPASADRSDFAMLHDGSAYRFYYQTEAN